MPGLADSMRLGSILQWKRDDFRHAYGSGCDQLNDPLQVLTITLNIRAQRRQIGAGGRAEFAARRQ